MLNLVSNINTLNEWWAVNTTDFKVRDVKRENRKGYSRLKLDVDTVTGLHC